MDRNQIINSIINLEWKQFDKVQNHGGRASCQDDWETFSIMRKSQYMTWTDELLESYYKDLTEAEEKGWNLITEKYARMMESTAPEEYEELKDKLPPRNAERLAFQEEIIKIQIRWMEDFAKKYPNVSGNGRNIYTEDDNLYNTSYETYLRGELGTYSEKTIALYRQFISALQAEGKNLAQCIIGNTVEMYSYKDLDDAEKNLG